MKLPNLEQAIVKPEKVIGYLLPATHSIQAFDNVVLTVDLPQFGLVSGDIETIVMLHASGKGYEVEFVTLDGETIAVTSLLATQVRPILHKEIAHVRRVAA